MSVGELRAHRTRVLRVPPPPHHVSISQPPPSPRVPREGSGPAARAQERGPGCPGAPGHAVSAQRQHAPGRGHSLPAGSEAPCSGCQHRQEPPASYLGRASISQSLFPQHREKRASREGKRAGAGRGPSINTERQGRDGMGRDGQGWDGQGWDGVGAELGEPPGVLRASAMPWGGCQAFGARGDATAGWTVRGSDPGEGRWAALPASQPPLPSCPLRPRPRGLCVAGGGGWPLPGGPLQSLQKGSRHLASPADTGGRERRALGGV